MLPNALPNGVYQSWLSLYNTDTGMIGTELLLETWVQEGGWDPASVAPLTVSADRISDLILYQQPDGDPYDILLDENVSLILTFVDSETFPSREVIRTVKTLPFVGRGSGSPEE